MGTGTFIDTHHTVYEVDDCPNCGVLFGLTRSFDLERQKDGRTFYCPNGHSLSYGQSEADKLREKLRHEKKNVEFWRERSDTIGRSRAAIKGQLTKERKRVANGVCPCCNRTFQNLSKHMAGQHPEYVDSPAEPSNPPRQNP